ncbi:unnamed protein product [Bursaphelenchus xylophilus]|uniref:(pine wood nematode) hypothetical protein n=1 Tax=Bursaphelenchus xylophilus TaxID=6326 RepID=A0A1I7RYF9_BURXY|nr:unnamed protein product [Bursaphelenchus xylophilus]CAG9085724.1 unnamed protein product [Bursaphelenchus xylophilus]
MKTFCRIYGKKNILPKVDEPVRVGMTPVKVIYSEKNKTLELIRRHQTRIRDAEGRRRSDERENGFKPEQSRR